MRKVISIIAVLVLISHNNSQVNQEWLARYSVGPFSMVRCVGTDMNGNVFIGGYSYNNYLTVKYNPLGNQQWAVLYNGPPGYNDNINALAIDISGNVYVTGASNGGPSDDDYTTIKYNSAGVQQWLARYNGIANYIDNALAICLDNSGSTYVTGMSYVTTQAGITDYATVKYNSSGIQQWAVRYNGPGNNTDYANAICTDNNGFVYVTGYSNSSSSYNSTDYATLKYSTSSGSPQWAARYNGPANLGDAAIAIAVDNLGNVYVTGGSHASSSNGDILTIKYNSSGAMVWFQRFDGGLYDGASDLKLDYAGNVYVCGTSNSKYVTIKYSTAGAQQWIMYYNGPLNQSSQAAEMVVDRNGNSYVTGSSDGDYATVKYNTSGVQQWVMRFDEPRPNMTANGLAIAIDSSLNVIVSGVSQQEILTDIGTIKYSQLLAIQPISSETPKEFSLSQNYPNPFNPTTKIKFSVPFKSNVTVKVFNYIGAEIQTLVNQELSPAVYEASWDASKYSSGIYYYRLTTGSYTETKKMVLLK